MVIISGVPIFRIFTVVAFEKSIDPDEVGHNELPHLDLQCFTFFFNSLYSIAWKKNIFKNFVCFFWCCKG